MPFFNPVFDYRSLRLLMGLIALLLPFVVYFLAGKELTSISASYYSDARDMFVGMLFIVGAFLFAYNGHDESQSRYSKIASLAAILVATFPTTCDTCSPGPVSTIHFTAAIGLFSILSYFCFSIFREKTKGQGGKKSLRSGIYLVCGWIMVISMGVMLLAFVFMSAEELNKSKIIFCGEATALIAFGVAWIVSGKSFRLIADEADLNPIFSKAK